jgi:hypothetical protein
VVPTSCARCAFRVSTQRRPDAWHFVGRHANSYAREAKDHSLIAGAGCHRRAHFSANRRISVDRQRSNTHN